MEYDLMTAPEMATFEPTAFQRRVFHGEAEGDISELFSSDQLSTLARDVVDDYERDLADNADWRDKADKAMKRAAQEDREAKDYPWPNAANVKFPMLTVAALQFNARAYPAIVKGDEAVSVKVVGRDAGRPSYTMGPQGLVEVVNPETGEPVWAVPPGAKMKRGNRVKDYLNTLIF
jgi:chaperonin GroES